MAAVAAARDLAEAAHAAERAEQDAARSAESAGIHRLAAARLTASEIAALCGISPDEIQDLQTGDAIGRIKGQLASGATGQGVDTAS